MEGSRVNDVTLSRGRLRVGKHIAKVGVTSFGADLGTLHIVRRVLDLEEEIFRDRLGERGEADPSVKFVERNEKRFAGNDVDVDTGLLVIPELILESPLGATLAHDGIFLSLQSLFQDGVAGNGTVRIESCGLLFFFLREKEEIEPTGDEQDCDTDTNVRADGRFFLGGDSAPTHQIVIESETGHVRQDGTGARSQMQRPQSAPAPKFFASRQATLIPLRVRKI
jgi:hypothetical protein